jgi:hypothetical protein
MRNLIETRSDVTFEHPLVAPLGIKADLLNGVLSPPFRPTRNWTGRNRLQDRFQHQLQRSLHNTVSNSGNTESTFLTAARLRDHTLPHRQRLEGPRLQLRPKPFQKPGYTIRGLHNRPHGAPVDPRTAHRYSPAHLLTLQSFRCSTCCRPSPCGPTFPSSEYYGDAAPPHTCRSAMDLPATPSDYGIGRESLGWFPCSLDSDR